MITLIHLYKKNNTNIQDLKIKINVFVCLICKVTTHDIYLAKTTGLYASSDRALQVPETDYFHHLLFQKSSQYFSNKIYSCWFSFLFLNRLSNLIDIHSLPVYLFLGLGAWWESFVSHKSIRFHWNLRSQIPYFGHSFYLLLLQGLLFSMVKIGTRFLGFWLRVGLGLVSMLLGWISGVGSFFFKLKSVGWGLECCCLLFWEAFWSKEKPFSSHGNNLRSVTRRDFPPWIATILACPRLDGDSLLH